MEDFEKKEPTPWEAITAAISNFEQIIEDKQQFKVLLADEAELDYEMLEITVIDDDSEKTGSIDVTNELMMIMRNFISSVKKSDSGRDIDQFKVALADIKRAYDSLPELASNESDTDSLKKLSVVIKEWTEPLQITARRLEDEPELPGLDQPTTS